MLILKDLLTENYLDTVYFKKLRTTEEVAGLKKY